MARDKALWDKIRAEFLATGKSYPSLAEEYGVSLSSLKKRAAKESWTQDRNASDLLAMKAVKKRKRTGTGTDKKEPEPDGALEATQAELVDLKAERLEKFFAVTDGMMDRIQEAIQSPEVLSPYALKLLASALRDLREMQGLNRSALDIEEQMARIAKLRMDTQNAAAVGESGNGLIVEFIDLDGAEE